MHHGKNVYSTEENNAFRMFLRKHHPYRRPPRLNSTKLLELRDKPVHVLDLAATLPGRGLCGKKKKR